MGRLVRFGDLAVQITKQYNERFGAGHENIGYKNIIPFLMHSKLIDDLDKIFKPYAVTVYNISPEHIFFTTKKDLYWNSKVATDPKQVPERILDCMIGLELH